MKKLAAMTALAGASTALAQSSTSTTSGLFGGGIVGLAILGVVLWVLFRFLFNGK